MSTSTFKTTVFGDDYSEVIDAAEEEICNFLGIEPDELIKKANYELIISKDDSVSADLTYKAEVIARIR